MVNEPINIIYITLQENNGDSSDGRKKFVGCVEDMVKLFIFIIAI